MDGRAPHSEGPAVSRCPHGILILDSPLGCSSCGACTGGSSGDSQRPVLPEGIPVGASGPALTPAHFLGGALTLDSHFLFLREGTRNCVSL